MRNLILIGLLLSAQFLSAQHDTSAVEVTRKPFVVQAVVPATLLISGIVLNNSFTEKSIQKNVREKLGNDYHNGMDDYIQYVPYVEVFAGDLVGIQAKNHWFDQTKNMAITGVMTTLVIHSLKRGVGKLRPDNSSHHSFPSGHTATAFAGATILYNEYKDTSPLLAYNGFVFSSATGSLRIMNNRHWLSDVMAGAGIGMLVAHAVYYWQPLKNWNPFKDTKNIGFMPVYNGDELTMVATFRF
ncbi:MAG: phosphatase PAP2 family protein [Flavobacteriales bacterium]|nr:phosphatase PAP2 family protein [Flavobacteriales bacterium]